ncbi:MAG: GNAT family protein [Planctomycetota bacterium]
MEISSIQDHADLTLDGSRVSLTPLALDNVDELVRFGLDVRIWEKSPFPMESANDLRAYVEAALREKAEGQSLPFVTRLRASGDAVGCTRFGNVSTADLRAEIGWTWLAPQHWRTGINVEAKLLMLTFAFDTLGLRRVEFKTDERNARSRAAIEALGATFEGTHRKHMVTRGGGVRNSVYYSILDDEWPGVRELLAARSTRSFESPVSSAGSKGQVK